MTASALRRAMTAFTRPPDPADADLLRQFADARSEAAFAALVRRHGPLVLGVCRRVVPDRHLADDAFQAAFVVLARRAGGIDPTRPLGPWLYGVAHRVALRARTMLGKRRKREHLAAAVPDTPRSSPAIDDATGALDEEIAKLPPAARDAVILCELQGMSRREAAAKLGVAEGTLSSRLASARKALAAKLRSRGVVLSAALAGAAVVSPELASAAVGAATGTSLSSVVVTLADGASATTLFSKLKLTGVAVLFLLLSAGGVGPWGANQTAAAPVPKQKPEGELLWVLNDITFELKAFSPDGKEVKGFRLPEGDRYLGLSPDGQKIAFAGKGGKVADPKETSGLTVHIRDVGTDTDGTDTGLECLPNQFLVWSPDARQVISGAAPAVYDLATRKRTELKLPADHHVRQWAPDGSWLLVCSGDDVRPSSWFKFILADGKLTPIATDFPCYRTDVSPDGRHLIGYAHRISMPEGVWREDRALVRVDVATGKETPLTEFAEPTGYGYGWARWAPDGKRLAFWCSVREKADDPDHMQLSVCDAATGERKTIATLPFNPWVLQGWFPARKVKAPVPEEKDPPEGTFLMTKLNIANPSALVEVVGTDGTSGGHLELGELHNVQQVRVSPDGKRLAFVRFVPLSGLPRFGPGLKSQYAYPQNEVYVADLPITSPPKEPIMKGLLEPSVAWAADGKSLFVSRIPAGTDMDKDAVQGRLVPKETVRYDLGTKEEPAVKLPDGHVVLDASADGKTLLTGTLVWHPQVVARTNYLVPLDTLKPKRIGDEEDGFDRARLSPDGTKVLGMRVAFSRSNDLGLFVADVASGKVEKVAVPKEMTEGLFNGRVMWAPDGKRVAVFWVGSAKKGVGGGLPGGPGGGARVKTLTVMGADGKNARTVCEVTDDSVMDVEWADPKLTDPKKDDPKAKPPAKEPITAPVPKAKPPVKLPPRLDRPPPAPPELARELAGWDSKYRHGSEEKFAEMEKRAAELAKEHTDPHDQARVWYTVAHVAAQSVLTKHADRVREYAGRCLKISRDPLARAHLYSYLASCEELGKGEFADRRRKAAEWLFAGYLELLAQELPDEKPELPRVSRGDEPDEADRARYAAQVAALEHARWVHEQIDRRNTLVLCFRNFYEPVPQAHGRGPDGPDELRKLAEAMLPTTDDADTLLKRVRPAK